MLEVHNSRRARHGCDAESGAAAPAPAAHESLRGATQGAVVTEGLLERTRGVVTGRPPPLPRRRTPPLKWSPQLAREAQAYANACQYRHSTDAQRRGKGENMVSGWVGGV